MYCTEYVKKMLLNFVLPNHFSLVVPLICHSLPSVDCQSLIYAPASQLNSHRECAHVHTGQWQKSAKKTRPSAVAVNLAPSPLPCGGAASVFCPCRFHPKKSGAGGVVKWKKVLITEHGLYFAGIRS
jgi:hypothetical protein